MSIKNLLSGIVSVQYCFADEIKMHITHGDATIIHVISDLKDIPISYMNSDISSSPSDSDAGCIYEHLATLRIRKSRLSKLDLELLKEIKIRGCVLFLTTPQKELLIMGTSACPLFGPVEYVVGKKVSDFSGYVLTLKGKSQEPIQPVFKQ